MAVAGKGHMENGLATRLIAVSPPRAKQGWSNAEVPQDLIVSLQSLYDILADTSIPLNQFGNPDPHKVLLSSAAGKEFREYVDIMANEQLEAEGFVAGLMGKAKAWAARLALIIYTARKAVSRRRVGSEISREDMNAGIEMAVWFAEESNRAYAIVHEDPIDKQRRMLIEIIQGRGGEITVRELSRKGPRRYRNHTDLAQRDLDDLVKEHHAEIIETPIETGGRPVVKYRIVD